MKLFGANSNIAAARNDAIADAETSHTWWPWFGLAGAAYTSSGLRVNEEIALTFSAVFCATRIVSETLAALPLNFMEQLDDRHSQRCTDDQRWSLLHDQPSPEQDSMSFLDQMTAWQVNWGNAYAEKQYYAGKPRTNENIAALWPIHPSRIPPRNINRNPMSPDLTHPIRVGDPGEVIYWVNNDDGSRTPIPARDMLHIPGVLSQNGITGQGIVRWGANSIGVGLATDRHAAAFFRNGAVTNVVIKSPKIVGEETAQRLRAQWQQVFGGVDNHYKTLLLEQGMEAMPVNLSAEDSQLIQSRQFGISEIARWYRLPPHMLADLSRSSFSNIESENLSFVIHSMMPWIVRWERALKRQLLTPDEKAKYFFRFNVNGLLRGDHAARAAFYQAMFNLGAYSPNDIRANEDLNPVEGGDTYFVQGNNVVPLDKAGDLLPQQKGNGEKRFQQHFGELKRIMAEMIGKADSANGQRFDRLAEILRLDEEKNQGRFTETIAALAEHHFEELDEIRAVDESLSTTQRTIRETIRDQERISFEALSTREQIVKTVTETLTAACRSSLVAAVSGMMAFERQRLLRLADKPGSYLAARDEFYADFALKFSEAIGRFAATAASLELCFTARDQADRYIAQSSASQEELIALPCDQFKAALEQLLEARDDSRAADNFVDEFFHPERATAP